MRPRLYQTSVKVFSDLLLVGMWLLPQAGFAAPTLQQMLTTLQASLPAIQMLFSAAAYIMGMGFVMAGVYQLRVYGESRMMMPSHSNVWKPIASIFSGAMLLYLPTAYRVVMTTVFNTDTPSPLDYTSANQEWVTLASTVVKIIELVGLAAFIKGFVLLARGGQGGGHQSTMGKAFTHILGGILAMNVVALQNILYTSLGLS